MNDDTHQDNIQLITSLHTLDEPNTGTFEPASATINLEPASASSETNMVVPLLPLNLLAKKKSRIVSRTALPDGESSPFSNGAGGDLKVTIPSRKRADIVELPTPFADQTISTNYHKADGQLTDEVPIDIWEKAKKVLVNAFHSDHKSKYSIKVELFDSEGIGLGTLETELHHNPGNYCFFCLDYMPESFKMKKGINISCISPYCSCCPKTIYDHNSTSQEPPKVLGRVSSQVCSNSLNIYNPKGELVYGLDNGNGFMRKFRFLLEAPFVFFCIPYKLAICCCLDMFYSGKTKQIKLYDHKNAKEVVVGIMTNHVKRTNEFQEIIRDGEKISQVKGEEIFLCKQFEVNMPEEADEAIKKLIIGALISELPSTVDRCAC